MKTPIKHTRIKIFIKPLREKGFNDIIILKNIIIKTIHDADRYFDYGGLGNHYIESYMDISEYGVLETWKIKSIRYLTDYDLIKPPKTIADINNNLNTLISLNEEKILLLNILIDNTDDYIITMVKKRLSEIEKDIAPLNVIRMMNDVDNRKKDKSEIIFDPKKEFKKCNAWLKPDGQLIYLYNDALARHNEYASEYLRDAYDFSEYMKFLGYRSPYEFLEDDLHWIRILSWGRPNMEFYPYNMILTPQQYKTLKDYCFFTGSIFPYKQIKNINEFE